jgi:arginyl-tRNA synthetase
MPECTIKSDLTKSEVSLLRILTKWPKLVKSSADNLAIHQVTNFVHSLSSQFNNFYRDCKVIGDVNEQFRINLVFNSKRILFDSLNILGIEAPEKM